MTREQADDWWSEHGRKTPLEVLDEIEAERARKHEESTHEDNG